ncbi:MAG TPA: MauE/DoxX family redox-associated membrane protein [Solirubrobacteraceae bacterium]|nr:MauE/DoxX family redox-associated membrane protein [Solirubrobacteraceae bacterium]
MLPVLLALLLGAVLAGSALLKLADGARTRAALATYGIRGERAARAAWSALIAVELAIAVTVAAGVEAAAWAGAALFAAFAVAQAVALTSGRAGAPCACFGARGRVGRGSLARAAGLAVAFSVLPQLERREPSTEGWLAIGLGAALLGIAALGVAVLALARELGALRAEIDPRGALEIPEEGPELGGRSALMEVEPGRLGLAVFTSDGCGMCRALEPAIEALGRDPLVRLRTFDEVRDAHAWAAAGIPGSPFAVALDEHGTVLAKGTFNTAGQLESVLATAERRRA